MVSIGKRTTVAFLVLTIGVILLIGLFFGFNSGTGNVVYVESDPVLLTPENLQAYLGSNSLINDLPRDAHIEIRFGEGVYSVEKSEIVREVIDNPDFTVRIPENYLNREWTSLCSIVKTANENGDLRIDYFLSKERLIWKYRGMIKYRSCI